ncbi:S9 family peptidase [Caulobacter segnis]|uniref:alpha/beta hydrolase family protein n=1 Tax=Caulobacter segnis TaxID=88688 RepID=UPI00240FFFEE|nr:S9 family peptidase [Caulobacter segnis]MDG2523250.1 S9 family peptidase [Caulobacter segnis]
MIRTFSALASAFVLSLASPAFAAPLEAYGRLPKIEDVNISPDGKRYAVSGTNGEQRLLIVRRVEDDKLVIAIGAGSQKIRDVRWAGSDHLVVTTSQTTSVMDVVGDRREWMTSIVLNVAKSRAGPLLAKKEQSMNVVVRIPEVRIIKGRPIIYAEGIHFLDDVGVVSVFRHDPSNGKVDLLQAADFDINDWEISPTGVPFAKSLYNQQSGQWTLRLLGPEGWTPVETSILPYGSPGIAGLGRQGASVVTWALKNENGDGVWREHSLNGSVDLPHAFDDLIFDPGTSALIGGYELAGEVGRHTFFNPADTAAWTAVSDLYKGRATRLISWSVSRRQIIALVEDPVAGPAYALVDLDTGANRLIGPVYPELTPDDVAEVKHISYKAADGLELTGYLTLPRGKDPKNLPLIVLPHGGPAARDTPGFDWWSQALAARGYAVLRPNYRGSEGFGRQFLEAGFGEWGRKMQTDLSDGVRDLAGKGVIDPKRVCIVGASYGGYAALAGTTLEKGVYRCAVSVAGVSDLKQMVTQTPRPYGSSNRNARTRYWLRFWGVDDRRSPDLAAISPAQQAAKADAPILLIHGKDDTVVPYEQTRLMADALTKAGKKVEVVTLPGEDHGLSRGDTRLQMLQATVAFLEKENPPQ